MKNAIQAPFALAIMFGLVVGVWRLLTVLIEHLFGLPQPVLIAVITATVVPVGSVATLMVGKYYEGKRAIQQDIRAKKTVAYEALLQSWTTMMLKRSTGKDAEGNLTPEFLQIVDNMQRSLIVWGSDEVLRRWSRFRRRNATGLAPGEMVSELDDLLRSIRKDIGHSNRSLQKGDIMGIFINDIPVPSEDTAGKKGKK